MNKIQIFIYEHIPGCLFLNIFQVLTNKYIRETIHENISISMFFMYRRVTRKVPSKQFIFQAISNTASVHSLL